MIIEALDGSSCAEAVPGLARVLVDCVQGGASVGFLAGLTPSESASWWLSLLPDVASGAVIVLVARTAEGIAGTVQLRLEGPPNGSHRAEVAKLLVHRDARRQGLGRRLMASAEDAALTHGRWLLVLDTQTGSAAERLYRRLGWTALGPIPEYAAAPDGALWPTTVLYKRLRPP